MPAANVTVIILFITLRFKICLPFNTHGTDYIAAIYRT
jgi:hypothetical protein